MVEREKHEYKGNKQRKLIIERREKVMKTDEERTKKNKQEKQGRHEVKTLDNLREVSTCLGDE